MNNKAPRKWKMMLLTWLFVYPVINILFAVLFPIIQEFHQLIKTLILTLILVPLMGLVLPKLHQHFGGWLRK